MKRLIALMLLCAVSLSAQTKVADKKFWGLTAASVGLTIADEEVTQHLLKTGNFKEANPLLGQSRKTAYPLLLGWAASSSYFAYRFKKGGSKIWYVPEFVIGRDGTREEVISKYTVWIWEPKQTWLRLAACKELTGKTLGCYCYPERCHGEILQRITGDLI